MPRSTLRSRIPALIFFAGLTVCATGAAGNTADQFVNLFSADPIPSLEAIESNWQPGFEPMVLESVRLMRNPAVAQRLMRALRVNTGKSFAFDLHQWHEWIWNQPERRHPDYVAFKSRLYGLIDPAFSGYFNDDYESRIRLDEVIWGGVAQDGIPPLRKPRMIDATQADYLDDDNVVFGVSVNGDTRAYPKRILAWHEMFVDDVGGVAVAGVYCTLCGTVILYKTRHNGVNHELGTSGFLYRSNKLMYDRKTQSLWNTLWGEPVIGPLVGSGIKLDYLSIVTTTWGEWRRRHPETRVLSLETGHARDYGEGVAYRDYFATDDLMFAVPQRDTRLLNKEEIFAVVLAEHPDQPLAISTRFLQEHPVYHGRVGQVRYLVLTDQSGANRLYQARDFHFSDWDGDRSAIDQSGSTWEVTEDALVSASGDRLLRLPAYRAFWFGWYAAYPHTKLIN